MVFTLADVINICSAFLTVAGVVTIFVKLYKSAKAPEKDLLKRVEKLEKKIEMFENMFAEDKRRFAEIEEGNRHLSTQITLTMLCLYLH